MSERLYEREKELLQFTKTYSGEDQDSCRALARAVDRCERDLNLRGMVLESVERKHALESLSFVLPIARKLSGIIRGSSNDAEKKKREALHWVGGIIEKTFAVRLLADKDEMRALQLISTAHRLCNSLDRLPTKKELLAEAKRWRKRLFELGSNMERLVLDLAGLKDLPQSHSGGRPKKQAKR